MSVHQGFYRRYRPLKFKDVIGQPALIDILTEQIYRQKINHAYLFAGLHGTGKTSTARIFGRAINCLANQHGEVCDQCKICKVNHETHSDIIEIDAASNNGVEQIRTLQEQAYLSPLQSKHKVYIIDEVHMLSKSAYNAFLKLLEEPPKHVVFVLATTDIHKIPPTILSRCQIFRFNPITQQNIVGILKKIAESEIINAEDEVLEEIAKTARGSVRDAINVLEQGSLLLTDQKFTLTKLFQQLGRPSPDLIFNFLEALLENKTNEALELSEQITKNNTNYSLMISAFITQINENIFAHYQKSKDKDLKDQSIKNQEIILEIMLQNVVKSSPAISNKTALQILIWKILNKLHSFSNSETSFSSSKKEPITKPSSTSIAQKTTKTEEPQNMVQTQPKSNPVINNPISSAELIAEALSVLKNRDKNITLQVKTKWQSLEEHIGDQDFDHFIKLFLSARLIAASPTKILLVVYGDGHKSLVQEWNSMPLFQKWLSVVFTKSFQVIAIDIDQLEVVKIRFKQNHE